MSVGFLKWDEALFRRILPMSLGSAILLTHQDVVNAFGCQVGT
jgi:hypothetical protein